MCCDCVCTHLEQTRRQPQANLRPQIGAEEEQGDFRQGDARVVEQSPSGELQTAAATVSPGPPDHARRFGDEVQVSRHGLHLWRRPSVLAEAGHRGCGARRGVWWGTNAGNQPKGGWWGGGRRKKIMYFQRQGRDKQSPDGVTNPSTC